MRQTRQIGLICMMAALATTAHTQTRVDVVTDGNGTLVAPVTLWTANAQDIAAAVSLGDYVPTFRTITAGTGLTGGGSLAANRTISLANTAVAAGVYGGDNKTLSVTVDAQGRLTSAANATITPAGIGAAQLVGDNAFTGNQSVSGNFVITQNGTNMFALEIASPFNQYHNTTHIKLRNPADGLGWGWVIYDEPGYPLAFNYESIGTTPLWIYNTGEVKVDGPLNVTGDSFLNQNLTVNGSTILGNAVGDRADINAGTFTAPNANGTNATNVANVGTLDARYVRQGRQWQITNFSGSTMGGGIGTSYLNIYPAYTQLRANAGAGNARGFGTHYYSGSKREAGVSVDYFDLEAIINLYSDSRCLAGIYPYAGILPTVYLGAGLGSNVVSNGVQPGWLYRDGRIYATKLRSVRGSGNATRSSNVVTVATNGAHGLTTSDYVCVGGANPGSFQTWKTPVLSTPDSTTFTYASTGSNETTTNSGDQLGIHQITELASVETPLSGDLFSPTKSVWSLRVVLSGGTCSYYVDGALLTTESGFIPSSGVIGNSARFGLGVSSTANATSLTDLTLISITTQQ